MADTISSSSTPRLHSSKNKFLWVGRKAHVLVPIAYTKSDGTRGVMPIGEEGKLTAYEPKTGTFTFLCQSCGVKVKGIPSFYLLLEE
jgi:hypothetical protein